jgi:hypothetical protein
VSYDIYVYCDRPVFPMAGFRAILATFDPEITDFKPLEWCFMDEGPPPTRKLYCQPSPGIMASAHHIFRADKATYVGPPADAFEGTRSTH